jgi:molybdate transport system ATP-binding protein
LPVDERNIGFVFQKANLFQHLSVAENLNYGYARTPPERRRVDYATVVEMLELKPLLQRAPHTLSGGEQQRIAIARALLRSPGLLALDEPLAALDRERKHEILTLLRMLRTELSIPMLYVSHSIDEVARIADQLLLMEDGKIVASGGIQHMLTRLDLPLARDISGGAVIDAEIAEIDTAFALTRAVFGNESIQLPGSHGSVGQSLRLVILARDVSLSLERHHNTSILNILKARVLDIKPDSDSQVIVRLLVGDTILLARITRKSLSELGLEKDSEVYAQVKTVALVS